MTRDATTGVGRWRQGKTSRPAAPKGPTATSKWTEAAVLSTLLLAAVVIAGWIVFQFAFNTGPNPYLVPFWVSAYQKPGIPFIPGIDADRKAIHDAGVFATGDSPEERDQDNPVLGVMRTRLESLAGRTGDDAVVVYLSAIATVDHEGKVQIFAHDSTPYALKTQLPLSEVLERLKDCRAKHKLLILDIMRGMFDPRDVGGTADGVGDLIRAELASENNSSQLKDPDLLVITACRPGETALSAQALGHSVFGYFFHRGLTSKEADSNGDGLLHVGELARYLKQEVDGWALQYRGIHQQPDLLGQDGHDFVLAAIKEPRSSGGWGWLWPWGRSRAEAADRDGDTNPSAGAAADSEKGQEKEKGQDADSVKVKAKANADGGGGAEVDKAAEKQGTGDAGRKAKDGSQPGEPADPKGLAYPRWLVDGWSVVERWRSSGDFEIAPRVYRRLARRLIRAESRWRGGDASAQIQGDLEEDLRELTLAMDRARPRRQPPIRSVGQARALQGWQPDPALTAAVVDLLRKRRNLGDGAVDPLKAAVAETLAKLKGKSSLDLAGALVEAAGDEVLDPPTLAFLDAIVDQSKLPRDVIELRFLHQLALRAARSTPADWKPETARTAWSTVLMAEEANNQPRAFPWVRAGLDLADHRTHEAQVLLLPEAAGFASWRQITAAWDEAKARYQPIVDRQRAIRNGQALLTRALEALVSLIPYLEATRQHQLQADWLETAEKAVEVAGLLEPPQPQDPPAEEIGSQLTDATRLLERPLRNLLRPFGHDAIEVLIHQCRSETVPPDPALALQIEALLTTPLLAVQDRPALWAAERALDARLEKKPLRQDSGASARSARGEVPRDRAGRRFDRMAAFLKLAGNEKYSKQLEEFREIIAQASELRQSTGADLDWDMSNPVKVWSAMASCAEMAFVMFEQTINKSDRGDDSDRMGWLAPVYVAGFDDWSSNPARRSRERGALAAGSWLAGHYRHQSHDLHDLVDPDNFLDTAARECPTEPQGAPEIEPRIDGPSGRLSLSAKVPSATVSLRLLLTGADARGPQKAELSVVKPDDPRLRVTGPQPAAAELSPEIPTPATLTLEWSDEVSPASTSPPSGLFARVRMPDQRSYHALIPMAVVSADMVPRLALSSDPAQSEDLAMDHLRLRPIAGVPQKFFVFVKNPSPRLWNVIVEVLEGDRVSASSGTREKPLTVVPGSSLVVPSFGTPAPKPGEPLTELKGSLRLRLRDSATNDLLDDQLIPIDIAAPRDYLQWTRAQFVPEAPGQPNRLTVTLRALPQMTGPPCPVELVLPLDKQLFPTLLAPAKEAKLRDELAVGKPPVTLYAEKLVLSPEDREGSFYVNVDGVKRALWFRSRFPESGGPQRITEPAMARVRLHPTRVVESGKPARLRVEFEVDTDQADARLEFRLGQDQGGLFKDDLERWSRPAKRRRIGFDPKGEGGALLFEASVEDWVWEWPVPGLHGSRKLRARLLDARGRTELASDERDLTLDDQRPRDVAIDLPPRIDKGTASLPVQASATPPPAGIKEVAFYFGSEADFDKAVAAGQVLVKQQPADPDGRTWTATLSVPKDATGKLVVTARFKTGVDLTASATGEVAVIEPAKAEDKTKMEPAKPGAIEGIVKEGDRPQPNLDVLLIDPKPPQDTAGYKRSKTDAKGAFSFKDLDPKTYRLYCVKQGSDGQRVADKQVMVESGQTVNVTLELLR